MSDEIGLHPIMPLDWWRAEIGYNPWHFWGLADATLYPVNSKCNDVIREYGWQEADAAGRADIRAAIIAAEKLFLDNTGYWPAPVYSSETHAWPRFQNQRLMRTFPVDVRGGWLPVLLNEGHVRACGIKAYTELDDAADLIYTDQDGDGLEDTFMCSVATTVTDPAEIAVYFTSGDRLFEDNVLSDRWRIEPVQVTFLAGTATIIGKKWLCVKPSIYEDKAHYPIDPTVAANFITHVSIFRRYTKADGLVSTTDSQAALIWETRPCSWGCSGATSSTDPAAEGWVTARCGIRDAEAGLVTPAEAVYDAVTGTWYNPWSCISQCSEPDRVLIRVLTGKDLDAKGQMHKPFRTLIARLASAEMTRRICACDIANRELYRWQQDVSRVEGPETFQINLDVLNNPLGTRRGHIYAWQQFKGLARVVGTIP